jgi:hypothetical protein
VKKSDWVWIGALLLVVLIAGVVFWRRKHKHKPALDPGAPGPTTSISPLTTKPNIKSAEQAAAAKLQGFANASDKLGVAIGEKFGIPKNIAEPLGKYGNPVYLGVKGGQLAIDVGTAGAHGAKVAASSVAHAAGKVASSITHLFHL